MYMYMYKIEIHMHVHMYMYITPYFFMFIVRVCDMHMCGRSPTYNGEMVKILERI